MCSANGLRHPASASCLGRHLRLAGRCPNNSSLFPPLAAVVVVALCTSSEEFVFLLGILKSLRAFQNPFFHERVQPPQRDCFRRKRALPLPLAFMTPPVKMEYRSVRRRSGIPKL